MLRSEPAPRRLSLALAILVHVAVAGLVFLVAASKGEARGPTIIEIEPPPLPPVRGPRGAPQAPGGGPRTQGPKVPTPREPPPLVEPPPVEPLVEQILEQREQAWGPLFDPDGGGSAGGGDPGGGSGSGSGDPAGSGDGVPGGSDGPPGDHGSFTPASSEPMILRGDMVLPRLVHEVEPEYPRVARGRVQGTVVLRCVIGVDGRVRVKEVVHPVGLLTESAIEAVEQWRYEPALWNGRPQAVFQTVRVTFR